MKSETLKVVLDEELQRLLEALGLLQKIENGELSCAQCGTPISISSIALLLPKHPDYSLICSNPACIERQLSSRGENRDA